MQIMKQNLWQKVPLPVMYIVTTNSTIKRDGRLVMGRGAALEARNKIKDIDLECGAAINGRGLYGFIEVKSPTRVGKAGFGIFQVKRIFNADAELDIIKYSTDMLEVYAERNAEIQIRMNFPGIGAGRLKYNDVLPLLQSLPDNVTICVK